MRIKILLVIALACCASGVQAKDETGAQKQTLFTNVKVFNGTDNELLDVDVLVEGNMIKQVGKSVSASGATVIDGGGRTLMPGLFDTHTHIMFASLPMMDLMGGILATYTSTQRRTLRLFL